MSHWLTTSDIASLLDKSESTIRRMILSGVLPAHQIGSTYKISPEDFANYIHSSAVKAAAPTITKGSDGIAYTIEKTQQGYHCALAGADFTRQVDVYKLAKRGVGQCRRIWNDFANECPNEARMAAAEAESHLAKNAKANKSVDKVLVKAEGKKPAKKKNSAKASPGQAKLGRGSGATPQKQMAGLMNRALVSDNPAEREAAWQVRNG